MDAVEAVEGLSDRQYGFRKAKSTTDAVNMVIDSARKAITGKGKNRKYCAIITLDIKNAFNSAGWKQIISSLRNMNVPAYLIRIIKDYFSNRTLWFETDNGFESYSVTSGVPQGSVLGPLLWNIMYNGIFNLQIPEEATVVGFADDIAVIVTAQHLDEVQIYANESVRSIKEWLTTMNLQLAEHKTELVLISGRRKIEKLTIKVGSTEITSSEAIKYLGIMVDRRLSFRQHLEYACKKAAGVSHALARMMPNIGGPRQSRRLLITTVCNAVLLYGAPIWERALSKTAKKSMISIYRRGCLRVCSGFRTISMEAASVVAGTIPIDLIAREFSNIHEEIKRHPEAAKKDIRQAEREKTMAEWQRRWENSSKGRWTFKLIPRIDIWLKRKHGDTNYNLTQFITGHGSYRSYLHRCGHDNSPRCPQCPEEDETAEHVTFTCPRFFGQRRRLQTYLGETLYPGNIIKVMLHSEESWAAINTYVSGINQALREAEETRKSTERRSLEDR